MNRANFRIICGINLLLFVCAGYAAFTYESRLPPELAAYLEAQYQNDLPIIEWVLGVFALFALIASVGIIFFARWARSVYLIGVVVTTAGTVFSGPLVQSSLETGIYEVGMVTDGLLIALMYFSEVKNEFATTNS
tara:strand:+ start:175 stop:579 length:405 start_codon:yes stop_codon:yes gene_type:complete